MKYKLITTALIENEEIKDIKKIIKPQSLAAKVFRIKPPKRTLKNIGKLFENHDKTLENIKKISLLIQKGTYEISTHIMNTDNPINYIENKPKLLINSKSRIEVNY